MYNNQLGGISIHPAMSISPPSLRQVPNFASSSSSELIMDCKNLLLESRHHFIVPRPTCFFSVRADALEGLNLMGGVWLRPSRSMKVKTESNVKREPSQLPDPPCVICKGKGKVRCNRCCGRGRLNFKEMAMLPKGEWPQWCWDCRGCGLSYCTRCLGTGEKRGIIGFHFPDDTSPNGSTDLVQN